MRRPFIIKRNQLLLSTTNRTITRSTTTTLFNLYYTRNTVLYQRQSTRFKETSVRRTVPAIVQRDRRTYISKCVLYKVQVLYHTVVLVPQDIGRMTIKICSFLFEKFVYCHHHHKT